MEKNSTAETNRPQLSFLVCACAFQKPQRKSSGFVVYITPKQFSSKPVQSHKRKTTQKPLQLLPQTVSKTALPETNNPWRQSDWEAIHPTDYSSSWHGLRDKACVFATSWLWRHRPHNRSDAQGKPSTSLLQWPQKKPKHWRFRDTLALHAENACH